MLGLDGVVWIRTGHTLSGLFAFIPELEEFALINLSESELPLWYSFAR